MADKEPLQERGVLSLSAAAWDEAERRAAVISPLSAGSVSHRAADAAGKELGLSRLFGVLVGAGWSR